MHPHFQSDEEPSFLQLIDGLAGEDLRALASLGCLTADVVPGIIRDAAAAADAGVLESITLGLFRPEPDIEEVGPWLDLPARTAVAPRPFGDFVNGIRYSSERPFSEGHAARAAEAPIRCDESVEDAQCHSPSESCDLEAYETPVDQDFVTDSDDGQRLWLAIVLRMVSGDVRVASWTPVVPSITVR